LLGEASALSGRVQSIAGGIEDRERSAGTNLLANVNPTFAWVRLAQRIPVRIVLDPLPDGVNLISGRTATVEIDAPPEEAPRSLLDRLRHWLSRHRSLAADGGGR
jgi:multidrug resistance efflux pump